MKHLQSIAFAAFAGCIGVALLPSLQADNWNKKTNLTVNEPLQVPSCCTPDHTVTLQPGEYVMVLVDSLSDRHIVRIFDKDQTARHHDDPGDTELSPATDREDRIPVLGSSRRTAQGAAGLVLPGRQLRAGVCLP